jgi:patatin-like phospholipase
LPTTSPASSRLTGCANVVNQLVAQIPEPARSSPLVRDLAGYGCLTQMHIVRLLAPSLMNEDHTKDVDFRPSGIAKRWEAGYANTRRAIEEAPWEGEFDPLDGVILHELKHDGRMDQDRETKVSPARLAMPSKVAAE